MTLPVQPPSLQNPPQEYDPAYMTSLLREINTLVQRLNAVGPLRGSKLNLVGLTNGFYGLQNGDVYVDQNGFLRWNGAGNHLFKSPASLIGSVGTVTTVP